MKLTTDSPENDLLRGLEPSADSLEREAESTLVPTLRLLWEHRRFLFKAAVWGLTVALVLAFTLPKRFEAIARLMPPDNQTSSLAMMAALSSRVGAGVGTFAGDLLGLKTSGAVFVGVLKSKTLQDRLVEEFELKKVYWERYDEDARKELEDRTLVTEDRKSGIISIRVSDASPERAAQLANAYTTELNRLISELSTSAARRERIFIEGRLTTVKQELDDAAKQFSEFSSKTAAIDIKEQGRAMVEAAAVLQGHLIAAQSELESLLQVYTDSNIRVRSVRARISELQRQLSKIEGTSGQTKAASAAPEEESFPSIRKLPVLGVRYLDLYRKIKIHETVFELLTQQHELAKVQEAKEIPSVKVLDVATPPQRRSFPPRTLIVVFTSLLTLGAACAWVVWKNRWEQGNPNSPARALATEVIVETKASWLKVRQRINR